MNESLQYPTSAPGWRLVARSVSWQSARVRGFIVGLVVLGSAVGCGEPRAPEEETETVTGAIVNGTPLPAPANRTGVERTVAEFDLNGGICTCTIVRPNWVLTAKHCVLAASGNSFNLPFIVRREGLAPSTVTDPAQVFIHPDSVVDAALVHLTTPITTGQSSVALFTGWDSDVVGQNVTQYGLGGNPAPTKAIVPVSRVMKSPEADPPYSGKYLFIGGNAQGQSTTGGDSGGPEFLNNQIVSVTGGVTAKPYARSFRNWANGILSPVTTGQLGSPATLRTSFLSAGEAVLFGDFNNDGRSDLLKLSPQGSATRAFVSLAPANAGSYGTPTLASSSTISINFFPGVGDVDGDGYDDLFGFDQSNGDVFVAVNNRAGGFQAPTLLYTSFSFPGEFPRVADMNGDGRADIIDFVPDFGDVFVAMSCGSEPSLLPEGCQSTGGFGIQMLWDTPFSLPGDVPRVGDFNGDGFADIATFTPSGDVFVALTLATPCTTDAQCGGPGHEGFCFPGRGTCSASLGHQPGPSKTLWATNVSRVSSGETPFVGDINGDGYADVINFENTAAFNRNGFVDVRLSNHSNGFGAAQQWSTSFCKSGDICGVGDSNRDGRVDAFRIRGGTAYLGRSGS